MCENNSYNIDIILQKFNFKHLIQINHLICKIILYIILMSIDLIIIGLNNEWLLPHPGSFACVRIYGKLIFSIFNINNDIFNFLTGLRFVTVPMFVLLRND